MRITRLTLKNIGPFDDATFEVPEARGEGEVVLFEGPNGCGKTTIAEVIAVALTTAQEGSPQSSVVTAGDTGAPVRSVQLRARPPTEARLDLEDGGARVQLSLTRAGMVPGPLFTVFQDVRAVSTFARGDGTARWAAFGYRAHHPTAILETNGPAPLHFEGRHDALSFAMGSQRIASLLGQELVNLEYDRVRAETYAREQPESDEFRLAAVANREAIERIERALSRVVDRCVEVRFPFHQTAPQVLFDGEEVPVDLLGEGLRSTVSWLADLLVRLRHTPWEDRSRAPFDQPFWLILDEVDQGLHPQLQMRLYPALRELFPRARIYGTTHSPFVVASLGDGDGVVFPIRPDPKTHRVAGAVRPWPFRSGNSLTAVIEEVFATPADFVEPETHEALQRHREAVERLRRGEPIDESRFAEDRRFLLGLSEEVATAVAMREAIAPKKVQAVIERAPPPKETPEAAE